MKIEKAEFSKMSQTGSSLIRSLQNNSLPVLDLLVREAVQNSLDAALLSSEYDSVIVDMGTSDIKTKKFAKHFEEIDQTLLSRFDGKNSKALYISDSNTTGLTGNLDYRRGLEEAGNIYKLIYGINLPQTKEGAGGSWGLGKTIYFRIGIGLVIYYTRICIREGVYEERLAAALVEDESRPNTLLSKSSSWNRGIAWWGTGLEEGGINTIPITNQQEIHDLLDSLNITPFDGKETGTKVIIPFVNENISKLNADTITYWWEESIESYLKIAVQRWYSPRLDNPKYPYGKWLDFKINGMSLKKHKMEAVFREVQTLYSIAANSSPKDDLQQYKKKNINVYPVKLGGIVKVNKSESNGGYIAFKKFSPSELEIGPPNNAHLPYSYINCENVSETLNSPIICYTRKPGMIINYELSGNWCNGIEVGSDEFVIAIYVPNSKSLLNTSQIKSLEEYLRKSEEADHSSWCNIIVDGNSTRLVSSIQHNMRKFLAEVLQIKEKKDKTSSSTLLAKKFGKILLPPKGFGKKMNGSMQSKSSSNINSSSSRAVEFIIKEQSFNDNGQLNVKFKMRLSKKVNYGKLGIAVLSESGNIKADDWEDGTDGIGTSFPVKIIKVNVDKINGRNVITDNQELYSQLKTKIILSEFFNVPHSIKFSIPNNDVYLEGMILLENTDPYIQFAIIPEFGVNENE